MYNSKNDKKYKLVSTCDKCKKDYYVGPFENMLGNGELAYSTITVHGDVFNLCPSCSYKLYNWLNNDGDINETKQ